MTTSYCNVKLLYVQDITVILTAAGISWKLPIKGNCAEMQYQWMGVVYNIVLPATEKILLQFVYGIVYDTQKNTISGFR